MCARRYVEEALRRRDVRDTLAVKPYPAFLDQLEKHRSCSEARTVYKEYTRSTGVRPPDRLFHRCEILFESSDLPSQLGALQNHPRDASSRNAALSREILRFRTSGFR